MTKKLSSWRKRQNLLSNLLQKYNERVGTGGADNNAPMNVVHFMKHREQGDNNQLDDEKKEKM